MYYTASAPFSAYQRRLIFYDKNAVIYARYSSDRQREESIEGQIRECKAFASTNGYEIIGIYTDRALSARTDQRPDFLRMIADSDRHIFQFVIVYSWIGFLAPVTIQQFTRIV